MQTEKVQQLASLLERLNSGENPAAVKQEAQEFLSSIDASELTMAEQKLLEAGLEPEDLRHLCAAHLEMLEGNVAELKRSLTPGHVIHTMISEHEMILGFLDKLEEVNKVLQQLDVYDGCQEFALLKHVAEHLVHAEPHHQREEDVLFPEVEARGMYGPPQIMRMEHVELRARKKELLHLAENVADLDYKEFKRLLEAASAFLVMTLRDHIFKENNILYPMAVQVILEPEKWADMKLKCDEIGYCCFTPSE